MAKYLVKKTRETPSTYYEEFEAEIDVAPGEDVNEVMESLPSHRWGWTNDWHEDDYTADESFEVVEMLEPDPDDDDLVRGEPEDFGLTQPELAA